MIQEVNYFIEIHPKRGFLLIFFLVYFSKVK